MFGQLIGGSALLLVGTGLGFAAAWGAKSFGTPSYQRQISAPSDGETTMWFFGAVACIAVGADLLTTGGQHTQQLLAALTRRC
ncbi:MAG TPA: hypothetical protein VJG64_04205 [Candidatus Paceibacterota bacterium]